MNTKKQSKKKTVTETKNSGGNISGKTQVNEKPSMPEKLLTGKTIPERSGGTRQPVAAGKPKATVTSNPIVETVTDKHEVAKTPAISEKADPATYSSALQESKAELYGITKEYTKSRNLCKATFILPGEAALKAQQVAIVGDFNNWNKIATPLNKMENGDFTVTLELEAGREYRFRYLIDNHRWENDWCADKYLAGPYGVEDSVVCV